MEDCGGDAWDPPGPRDPKPCSSRTLAAPGLGEQGQQGQPLNPTALPAGEAERVCKPKMGSDIYLATCSPTSLPAALPDPGEGGGLPSAAVWGPTVAGAG